MLVLGERFYQMSNAIFCYDLKPIPLAVYSYLVCCAGQKDVCWPSMKTIALHCGYSENAARDAVSLLVARCTSTTEYPPPKFILAGRSIARTIS